MVTDSDDGSSWSPLQMELVRDPMPMLFGSSSTVDGYCKLEKIERGVAITTISAFPEAVSLWYRGITIVQEPFIGKVTLPAKEPNLSATIVDYKLLTLAVSTTKGALDLLLAGQYSLAFAAQRHLLETTLQIIYLAQLPDQVDKWYVTSETPKMNQMVNQLKKSLKLHTSAEEYLPKIDGIYGQWKFLSKGAHPSGLGLMQIDDVNDSTRHMLGTQYRDDFAAMGFESGLFVLDTLILAERLMIKLIPQWHEQAASWIEESRKEQRKVKADPKFKQLWE